MTPRSARHRAALLLATKTLHKPTHREIWGLLLAREGADATANRDLPVPLPTLQGAGGERSGCKGSKTLVGHQGCCWQSGWGQAGWKKGFFPPREC